MPTLRPILLVNGLMLSTLGLTMLVPALLDAVVGDTDWEVFLAGAFITCFVGAGHALHRGLPIS